MWGRTSLRQWNGFGALYKEVRYERFWSADARRADSIDGLQCTRGCLALRRPARQIIAMDTLMQFTVYGQEAEATVQTAVEEVQQLEGRLSRTAPDSEVTNLNARAGERVAVSETLYDLIVAAKQYALVTGGEFDMTVAPVVEAWGFGSERQRVPEQAELPGAAATGGQQYRER